MSLVAMLAPGLTTASCSSGTSIGVSTSPMPSTKALRPPTKKGTSAPSFSAIGRRRSRDQFKPHSRLSASSVLAASD